MSSNLNPTKNAMRGLTVFISDLRNGMYFHIHTLDTIYQPIFILLLF